MAKKNQDFTEKLKTKLKDLQFRSPSKAKDPKIVEKQIKEVQKDEKKKKKEVKQKRASIIKKVLKKLN